MIFLFKKKKMGSSNLTRHNLITCGHAFLDCLECFPEQLKSITKSHIVILSAHKTLIGY